MFRPSAKQQRRQRGFSTKAFTALGAHGWVLSEPLFCPGAGEAVEPALVLKEERLEGFGGIEEVIWHFKKARPREAARNLLSVLLDYVSAKHITVRFSRTSPSAHQTSSESAGGNPINETSHLTEPSASV